MNFDKDFLYVSWEIRNGYAGKGRPQVSKIPIEEIENCGDLDAALDLVEEWVQEDFDKLAFPEYDTNKVSENILTILSNIELED